jgi:hypothetical protein
MGAPTAPSRLKDIPQGTKITFNFPEGIDLSWNRFQDGAQVDHSVGHKKGSLPALNEKKPHCTLIKNLANLPFPTEFVVIDTTRRLRYSITSKEETRYAWFVYTKEPDAKWKLTYRDMPTTPNGKFEGVFRIATLSLNNVKLYNKDGNAISCNAGIESSLLKIGATLLWPLFFLPPENEPSLDTLLKSLGKYIELSTK